MKKILLLIVGFSLCGGNITLNAQTAVPARAIIVPLSCPALPKVKIENHILKTKSGCSYQPFLIKGVGYHPSPIGTNTEWGYPDPLDPRPDNIFDDPAILNRDFPLLQAMHANTIRIWGGDDIQQVTHWPEKLTTQTFDLADQYGLKIIAGFRMPWIGEWKCEENPPGSGNWQKNFYSYTNYTDPTVRQNLKNDFIAYVNQFKNHQALLFWAIGNENELALDLTDPGNLIQLQAYFSLINEMALAGHQAEGSTFHPVAAVTGDIGSVGVANYGSSDAQMPYLDIWGANVYRGSSFYNLFNEFSAKSNKAFWVSEYGNDAFHTVNPQYHPGKGYEDQAAQALWDGQLWDEIKNAYNTNSTVGGSVFVYSDTWWQPYQWLCGENSHICNSEQNHFGTGPVDWTCPKDGIIDWVPAFPDQFNHVEWFGMMSIAPHPTNPFGEDVVTPRQAYYTLQQKWQ